MQKLLAETKEKAYIFLREFGFEEDELDPVVSKGLRDIEETLDYLKGLLNHDSVLQKDIDTVLHGLKGLLFHLGNHTVANKVEKLRYSENINEIRIWIDSL